MPTIVNGSPPISSVSPTFLGRPWASAKSWAIFWLMTTWGFPRSSGRRNRPPSFPFSRAFGKTALCSRAWATMSCPWITGLSRMPWKDLPLAAAGRASG